MGLGPRELLLSSRPLSMHYYYFFDDDFSLIKVDDKGRAHKGNGVNIFMIGDVGFFLFNFRNFFHLKRTQKFWYVTDFYLMLNCILHNI